MNSLAKRSARIVCSPPPDDRIKFHMDMQSAEVGSTRAFNLGDFLRDQLRNIAPFITLIVLVGVLQHREPDFRLARQSGEYPPAGVHHGDHGRRPDLRYPHGGDRSLRRRDRQRHRDRAHVLHAAAGLREHRQSADARRDRHHFRASGVRRAWPSHRLRRDPHRHSVLHHDARHDADRRRHIGGSGPWPDRLYGPASHSDARVQDDLRLCRGSSSLRRPCCSSPISC